MTTSARRPTEPPNPGKAAKTEPVTTEFRYTGGVPDELTGGRPLAYGDLVKLTELEQADPHNARLIADGVLIPTKTKGADAS